jgi:hypothetical protein
MRLGSHFPKLPQARKGATSQAASGQGKPFARRAGPGPRCWRTTARMTVRATIGALLALTALGLASAVGAQAASTDNLGWKANGKALVEGETAAITARAEDTQVFKEGIALRFECSKLELAYSKLVGAKSPAPGKGEWVIVYSGCVLPTTECKVSGISRELVTTNAYLTKAAAEKEEMASGSNGLLLAPKTGEAFVEFVVTPPLAGLCPFDERTTFSFKGSVIAALLQSSKETTYNEELQTHLIEATTLKSYFENEGGKTVEHTGAGLKLAGAEASWSGRASVSVAVGSKYNLAL